MNKAITNKFIGFSLLVICFILGYFVIRHILSLSSKTSLVITTNCPSDTRQCPDGSLIKRLPPTCEFEQCNSTVEEIILATPVKNNTIPNPLIIKGQAKGNWFFEGQFLAELYDDNGNLLGKTILRALEDWMTNKYVAFEGNLEFSSYTTSTGFLKLLSDNPSGLAENQKVLVVPLRFE